MKHNNTLKWIANTMGHSKWLVLFLTLIQIVLSVSSIFLAIGMRQVINAAVEREKSVLDFRSNADRYFDSSDCVKCIKSFPKRIY